jgi:hypothetical protein
MQALKGHDSALYDYDRAWIIRGRVSINRRFWYRASHFDYISKKDGNRLEVGKIRDSVIVKYTHKDYVRKLGKVRKATLAGEIIFLRARQYYPTPTRESNMWLAPAKPTFRLGDKAISVYDLAAFLHVAPERNGRAGFVHLIKVALAFA